MEELIEFIPETHTYLIDGIIVPSVTTLIKKILPDKYKNVNQRILNRKAEYGTKGHECIEIIDKSLMNENEAKEYISDLSKNKEINKDLEISLREYLRLIKKFNMEALENELIVHFKKEFIGTLDKIAYVLGKKCLIDIKFTAELDKEYLAWQLGMYRMAYRYLHPEEPDFEDYYCLWLPKGKLGQLVRITPKTEEEIINKLEEIKDDE